ncbi:MAG: peptidoglycan editing factor PgeF [Cellvibrionaceae bacterium]
MNKNAMGFQPVWQTSDGKPPASVRAFVTYRSGGGSAAPFYSNNLALHVGDDKNAVEKNRENLSALLHLDASIAWLNQVHSDRIVTENNYFTEFANDLIVEADGVISSSNKLVCAIMTADCLPVLFCNKQGTQVAAIHAGWRGLANGILKKAVLAFKNNEADDLMVFLGPGIGRDHYEVGEDVISALELTVSLKREKFSVLSIGESKLPEESSASKYYLDMIAVARAQLTEMGVMNISGGDHCSFAEAEHFYSYRRDGVTGRMASLIWLES